MRVCCEKGEGLASNQPPCEITMDSSKSRIADNSLEINSKGQPKTSFANFASFASQAWPEPLSEAAYHGLAGMIVKEIAPHTEADPAALLIQLLLAFGNAVGRSAHFRVEDDLHYMNEFAVLVGETSKARKGTSWGRVSNLFEAVDPVWRNHRIQSGLSSGEGLIWAVRDPASKKDHGVADKRLLVYQSEFGSVLKVLRREGNTLSAVVREAWDSGKLNTLVKNKQAKATGAYISIIGHITREELLRHLDDTEYANGFGNRYLWVCVKRSNILPDGGNLDPRELDGFVSLLTIQANHARTVGEMRRDKEATQLWHRVYPALSEGTGGLFGAITGRAEAHVVRLSCLYALLYGSPTVQKEHLEAALALWKYCEASCRYIFGHSLGDPLSDELLRNLRLNPTGMSRTDIMNHFQRHKSATQIQRALDVLESSGLAISEKQPTKGRPTEVWKAATAKEAK